jgi:hypothetical protein
MAHPIIVRASQLLKHVVGVLLLAWLRALRAAAIAGALGILAVEVGAVVLTHHFPPGGTVQLVAAALGGALAYGAAATVVASELITGTADAIGLLLGEAEAGARAAAAIGERDVGEASGTVLRAIGLGALVGAPARPRQSSERILTQFPAAPVEPAAATFVPTAPATQPATLASAAPAVPAARASEDIDVTEYTLAELAPAADAPGPRPRVDAGPVPAGQLPRIAWIDEQPTVPLAPAAAASATAPPPAAQDESAATSATAVEAADTQDDLPDASEAITLPLTGPMAQQPITTELSAAAPAGAAPGEMQAGATGPGLSEPAVWHDDHAELPGPEQWHNPSPEAEPEEEEAGIKPVDLFGALPPSAAESRPPDSNTRPLPERTRPLDTASDLPAPRGSIWEHISQVLAGRPVEPLPTDDSASTEEDPPSDGVTPPGV